MVPLGISAAGGVRVGQVVGRRDAVGARCAGWLALGLRVTFMSVAAATFVTLPAADSPPLHRRRQRPRDRRDAAHARRALPAV